MSKLLFFDLETTGLPNMIGYDKYYHYSDLSKYDTSRIVQISIHIYEYDNKIKKICVSPSAISLEIKDNKTKKIQFNMTNIFDYIVKPNGFKIENSEFHGITNDIASTKGIEFKEIIPKIIKEFENSYLIAHNVMFDKMVLLSELYRAGFKDEVKLIENLPVFCTCMEIKSVTKIINKYGKYKNPKLSELYEFLFKITPKNLHNANADTTYLTECFFELCKRNYIQFI